MLNDSPLWSNILYECMRQVEIRCWNINHVWFSSETSQLKVNCQGSHWAHSLYHWKWYVHSIFGLIINCFRNNRIMIITKGGISPSTKSAGLFESRVANCSWGTEKSTTDNSNFPVFTLIKNKSCVCTSYRMLFKEVKSEARLWMRRKVTQGSNRNSWLGWEVRGKQENGFWLECFPSDFSCGFGKWLPFLVMF